MKTKEAGKEKQKHLRIRIHSRFFKKSVEKTEETEDKPNSKFPSLFHKKMVEITEETLDKSKSKFPILFRKKSSTPIFDTPPVVLEIPSFETNDTILDQYWLTPHIHT
ncbi:hypothetical protein [uncultured Methanocorpusculum sp.]|nr:hypothetical protein [uncultured Methanocorpusculum sp.]